MVDSKHDFTISIGDINQFFFGRNMKHEQMYPLVNIYIAIENGP